MAWPLAFTIVCVVSWNLVKRNKTTPAPTVFGFVAKSVLLGPEPE